MAHGTPETLQDLPRFVTEVRRGRQPEPQLLDELERRYLAIGGTSPLAERTRWHAESIATALDEKSPGRFTVAIGYKFASPRIEEAVSELSKRGIERVVGIVLAPHYSAMSVGDYEKRAKLAGEQLAPPLAPLEVETVHEWYLAPGFVPLMAELVRRSVASLPDDQRSRVTVVFTAHSLPERILEQGDPYPDQLRESADVIAAAADVERYAVAWQSAGRSSEPWLGPDILDVIPELAAGGATAVIVCPVGFVSEHLEVLYDLDVEAAAAAQRSGIAFARTPSLDGDPRLPALLAQVVIDATA
jgi:ferrochelatase